MRKGLVVLAVLAAAAAAVGRPPVASGLDRGASVEPWNPLHVAGPDRGTNACPVCTYLEKPVVVVFAKDTPNTVALTAKLEAFAAANQKTGLRVVVAVTDAAPDRLARVAADLKVTAASLCELSPRTRANDLKAYRVNPAAENTVIVYKDYTVTDTFVDLPAGDFGRLAAAAEKLLR
jgi:protocatechuate 3,4-dioxygenase beta subunit